MKKVFISCQDKGVAREANMNTLSSWLKHTVADAYGTTPDSGSPPLHCSLHKVRAVAASIAKGLNVAMEDIMKQCQWAHQTTFTSFYLCDIKYQKDELHPLNPLMLAGAVIGDAPGGVQL